MQGRELSGPVRNTGIDVHTLYGQVGNREMVCCGVCASLSDNSLTDDGIREVAEVVSRLPNLASVM